MTSMINYMPNRSKTLPENPLSPAHLIVTVSSFFQSSLRLVLLNVVQLFLQLDGHAELQALYRYEVDLPREDVLLTAQSLFELK